MFEHISEVPGDAILGLMAAYKQDDNPDKVDLGVGVYKDETGNTPILRSVKEAEALILQKETTKTYSDAHGDPRFGERLLPIVFGADHPLLGTGRLSATESPGGTGALRLAADLIKQQFPGRSVWLSDPTWPNHGGLFAAAGVPMQTYPYVDADNRLDFPAMMAVVREIPEGDILLLHGCCHNPTGFDLSPEQWRELAGVIAERGLLPLVDLAYQGFGDGLDADAYGVRLLAETIPNMMITTSCSKNFGIYRERTGCLIVVAANADETRSVRSQIAVIARGIYSTPPSHGAALVAEILGSEELTALWKEELDAMRERINTVRAQLVDAMDAYGLRDRFACIGEQRGMFSYTGLSPEHCARLQHEFGIYMVRSGRANVAGLTTENIPYVAKAFAAVCQD